MTILLIAGFVLEVVVGVAIVMFVVGLLLNAFWKLMDYHDRLVRADERRKCGNRLLGNAWWFSEDMVTLDVLKEAGQDMLKGLDPLSDVSAVRERWRKARASAPGASSGRQEQQK